MSGGGVHGDCIPVSEVSKGVVGPLGLGWGQCPVREGERSAQAKRRVDAIYSFIARFPSNPRAFFIEGKVPRSE